MGDESLKNGTSQVGSKEGGTDGVGQYKTPRMRDSIRAQRRRARFSIEILLIFHLCKT